MDSTHGATNPFAGVPESASLSQTAYVDADAPPEEGEESAYVSFTASEQAAAAMPPPVLPVPPPEPDFGASSQAFQDLDISTPALAAAAQPASRFESKVEPGPGSQASAGGASSPNLLVTVTNPCMEGQGISSHFTYEVTTKTSLPQYKFGQFSVTRRFRDFDWVHAQLSAKYPGVIVPPLPEKQSPTLHTAPDLQTFLEASEQTLESWKESSKQVKVPSAASVLTDVKSGLLSSYTRGFSMLGGEAPP